MAMNQEKPPKSKKSFPKLSRHKTGQWYFRIPKNGCLYLGKDEETAQKEYDQLNYYRLKPVG